MGDGEGLRRQACRLEVTWRAFAHAASRSGRAACGCNRREERRRGCHFSEESFGERRIRPSACSRSRPPSGPPVTRRSWADGLFAVLAHAAAWITLAMLIGILLSLLIERRARHPSVRNRVPSGTARWDPVQDHYGGLPMIFGTLATSFIALCIIAVPGQLRHRALFLTELSRRRGSSGPLGIAIELLAAVPSIVYGMWGLFVFEAACWPRMCNSRCSIWLGSVPGPRLPGLRPAPWASASCRPASSWPS